MSPSTTSITADDFETFFTDKTKTISSFHLHSHRTSNQLHPLLKLPSSSPFPSLRRNPTSVPSLSSHPTTCPLDPILSHLLQAISSILLPALTHIINTSLLTGIFPTAFKQARVTPLLKKPTLNTSLIENYRPVSLFPFIAKTLERVVFNQVSLFLSQNNKLDAKQSGFRSGHSTETALLRIYIPSRSLRSASERRLVVPSQREAQNHSPEHSRSPFLAGGMIFLPPSGPLDPCQSSSNNWKLISFNSTWLHHNKNILPFFYIFIFLFLSFPC